MSKKKINLENGSTIELKGNMGKTPEGATVTIIDETSEAPLPAPATATRMLAVIEKASTDPRCNIEKMRALLDMQMELVREERRLAYNRAMWEAQGEMEPIVRRSKNESTNSTFAKLEHIDKIVRPIYRKHGFGLSFDSHKEPDGSITMFVDVMHNEGHQKRHELNAPVDDKGPKGTKNKTEPQGVASTTSILQRKLTVMVFNLTFINEDDDGQGGKKEIKPDRFAGEQPTPPQPLPLEEACARLEKKLRDEPDRSKRGEVLMKHIKVVGALEDAGQNEKAEELRKLAEEKIDEQQG